MTHVCEELFAHSTFPACRHFHRTFFAGFKTLTWHRPIFSFSYFTEEARNLAYSPATRFTLLSLAPNERQTLKHFNSSESCY